MPANFETMFRLPVLAFLACAIAGASPLSWKWDIFQPANSLSSPQYAIHLLTDPSNNNDVRAEDEIVLRGVTELDLSDPHIIGRQMVFGSIHGGY
jgi:hypothetical protein